MKKTIRLIISILVFALTLSTSAFANSPDYSLSDAERETLILSLLQTRLELLDNATVNSHELALVEEELTNLGFSFPNSMANFIFATHKSVSAKEIFEALREANIYVRYFNSPRIDNYLRITIGTRGEMEKLFGFLHTYLNK